MGQSPSLLGRLRRVFEFIGHPALTIFIFAISALMLGAFPVMGAYGTKTAVDAMAARDTPMFVRGVSILVAAAFLAASGAIRVRGSDVSTVPLKELRGSMALVPQEPWIFPGTVAENIALGNPCATRDQIIGAAVSANAHEFISALPQGYDTVLRDRGGNLSGGQRQRICLARAFLKDVPLLLLDEPTSSVDAESERLVIEAVDRLGAGRTVITISHTGKILENCDAAFALEDGRLNPVNSAGKGGPS